MCCAAPERRLLGLGLHAQHQLSWCSDSDMAASMYVDHLLM
jgi:hypothetical protein